MISDKNTALFSFDGSISFEYRYSICNRAFGINPRKPTSVIVAKAILNSSSERECAWILKCQGISVIFLNFSAGAFFNSTAILRALLSKIALFVLLASNTILESYTMYLYCFSKSNAVFSRFSCSEVLQEHSWKGKLYSLREAKLYRSWVANSILLWQWVLTFIFVGYVQYRCKCSKLPILLLVVLLGSIVVLLGSTQKGHCLIISSAIVCIFCQPLGIFAGVFALISIGSLLRQCFHMRFANGGTYTYILSSMGL